MFRHWGLKVAVVLAAAVVCSHVMWAQTAGSMQGVVKSSSGAPVIGAFVKLNNAERRLTFMVISQAQGHYTATNLPAGMYRVQAIGGEMQSAMSSPVEVAPGHPATMDVSLTAQRAPALPGAWPGRLPGQQGGEAADGPSTPPNLPDGAGKPIVLAKCGSCHGLQQVANARRDRVRWEQTIADMRLYMQGSNLAKDLTNEEAKVLLDYLATNMSENRGGQGRPKPDPNSRLPRTLMTGDQLNYRVVEFLLPKPEVEPHEIAVDAQGNAWITQRTGGKIGRLDVKTLEYKEFEPPAATSKTVRLNGIVSAPGGAQLWFVDGGPNRRWFNYDIKTGQFATYTLPKLKNGNASGNTMRVHPNGTVWLNSIAANQVIRLNPATEQFSIFDVPAGIKAGRTANPYGMAIDGSGKIWFVENAMNQMGRMDPVTGKIDEFEVPVKNAVPRKAGMDSEGNVWVGLHGAGILMKIDYKTTKMTLYTPPTEDAGVYSVQGDPKSKLVWFSEQHVDKIARFDPQTGTFTEFPLPNAESDHRRIDIDPNQPNRIWWTGNTSGRIGFIELPDKR
jgi:virginiamycin B lyase